MWNERVKTYFVEFSKQRWRHLGFSQIQADAVIQATPTKVHPDSVLYLINCESGYARLNFGKVVSVVWKTIPIHILSSRYEKDTHSHIMQVVVTHHILD